MKGKSGKSMFSKLVTDDLIDRSRLRGKWLKPPQIESFATGHFLNFIHYTIYYQVHIARIEIPT